MDKITKLAREYKQTRSIKILNELFLLLDKQLTQKAKFVYYQQSFKINGKNIKLKDTGKIELSDLVQEIKLEVLKLLERYDIKKPFSNYLFATLWNFTPEIVRKKDNRQNLNTITESELSGDNEEGISLDSLPAPFVEIEEDIDFDELFKNLNETERKLLNLMIKFPRKKQAELAEIMGVTQQRIGQIFNGLQKKYKNNL